MRDFTTVPTFSLAGGVIGQPILICRKSSVEPRAVKVPVNWIDYGAASSRPNVGVNISLENGPATPIDQISAVYVDNSGSPVAVFIQFPDTQMTVQVPPYGTLFAPVLTNGLKAVAYGLGFVTGQIPKTTIYFSNSIFNPFADTEIAPNFPQYVSSPVVGGTGTNFYTSGFGVPALGDIAAWNTLDLTVDGATVTLFDSPKVSGFFYLTAFNLSLIRPANAAADVIGELRLESTGVASATLFKWHYSPLQSPINPLPGGVFTISRLTGLQIKLDATTLWRIRNLVPLTTGQGQFEYCYTYAP